MKLDGKWITVPQDLGDIVPVFQKTWSIKKKINRATLLITALGVYEAELNGKRVSQYVLAPGWTAYEKRIQVQKYDITEMIQGNNALSVIFLRINSRRPQNSLMRRHPVGTA
jgi:alpha-L-rhamnosidase